MIGSFRYILNLFWDGGRINRWTEVSVSINPFDAPFADDYAPEMSASDVLFSFEGRIPRRLYWGYSLAVSTVFTVIVVGLTLSFPPDSPIPPLVTLLLYIPFIWVSLAITVKRWHDRGYSGWMMLIGFIPIVGPLWSFVELGCLRGTMGRNEYGADPT